ncbi:hypothetical protein [Sinorhizobium meliloti]|uniref:Uncharacterized protein n=1 Tax=Rhizobium meliloti TaxID=382 RepID=A0A2J0Z0G1_RHIML|nr:hypothetical protein [Sinorhizobium meliloti]PJR13954.1 hypothetical protein CEJ86_19630 [Sinorhizobium meliloti]
MNSRAPEPFLSWLGAAFIVAAFLAYLFLTTPSEVVLCRGDENCFRDWIGALSGWAGLSAALLTIRVMSRQLREQQVHTAYLRGDVNPTIYATREIRWVGLQAFAKVDVVVMNLNRRPLRMGRLEWATSDASVAISIAGVTVGAQHESKMLSEQIQHNFVHETVPGHEPGGRPTTSKVHCHVWRGDQLARLPTSDQHWEEIRVRIKLRCELLDSKEVPLILEAETIFDVAVGAAQQEDTVFEI